MNKTHLIRAAVALALFGTAPAVFAQTAVTQSVENIGSITNQSYTPALPTINASASGLEFGTSASASVSATGAVGSVSLSAINSPLPSPTGGLAGITQGVTNTGAVTNGSSATPASIDTGNTTTGGALGLGASASVSATGAVGSVSVSAISDGSNSGFTGFNSGNAFTATSPVSQTIANTASGTVANYGTISGASSLYAGASESVSATGAVGSVSESLTVGVPAGVASTGTPLAGFTTVLSAPSSVGQNIQNNAQVTNTGTITGGTGAVPTSSGFTPGLGQGASASIGATGAVASVSISALADLNGYSPGAVVVDLPTVGTVGQTVVNTGLVQNNGTVSVGDLVGNGASVSASATGAVGSVSVSGNNAVFSGGSFGGITQNVTESAPSVTNAATINVGNLLGAGDSVSAGATGAVASVSYSNIGGAQAGLTYSGISQTVTNSSTVNNVSNAAGTGPVQINVGTGAGVVEAGGSVSGSATGAVASVSSSTVFNAPFGLTSGASPAVGAQTYGAIGQTVNNSAAINNNVNINAAGVTFLGSGSSASVGATGAVASVSNSSNQSTTQVANYGGVTQSVFNQSTAPVTNVGSVTIGDLAGDGASASISATGAVGSVSVSSIDSNFTSPGAQASIGGVNQGAFTTAGTVPAAPGVNAGVVNSATVTNTGEFLSVGSLSGNSASASIGATGAVASASYSSIGANGTAGNPGVNFGAVTQNAYNNPATITNSGTLDVVSAPGTGSSASIASTGSVASFSVSSVSDTVAIGPVTVPSIQQTSYNSAAISNAGNINFAGTTPAVLGVGASASVAATGAVASASFRSTH